MIVKRGQETGKNSFQVAQRKKGSGDRCPATNGKKGRADVGTGDRRGRTRRAERKKALIFPLKIREKGK